MRTVGLGESLGPSDTHACPSGSRFSHWPKRANTDSVGVDNSSFSNS